MYQTTRNRLAAFMVILWQCLCITAQVRVTVQAPSEVVEGDKFRVSYVVNTSNVSDFRVDAFKGLTELYGPTQSTSSSFSISNGKTTSSSSITFTYTVMADKEGNYNLPQATVTCEGATYKSDTPPIRVLPAGNSSRQARGGNQAQQGQPHASTQPADRIHTAEVGERIDGKDLFIAVTASKKRVFEQEAVLLTYKLYTLVNVSEMTGKMPELDGFHVQEIDRQRQPELKMEHYNGKNYGTVVWSQYVVFPQHTGTLTIPPIKFEAIVIQQNRYIDPFEAFFNGGSTMTQVKKTIMSPAVTLQVEPLPSPKPANFSGAVGKFNIKASLTPQALKENDATTLRLVVNGVGNMKLMNAPEVAWPKDFESYDPKAENKTKITVNGNSGTVTYDYIAVPRHQGSFDLPPVEFCYFDPSDRQYKTAKSDAFKIDVAKGKGGGSSSTLSKEEVELLNSDIRYLKNGEPHYQTAAHTFFGSQRYWLWYAVSLLMLLTLAFVFRRQAAVNADVVRQRGRKANRAASRRLKAARRLMEKNEAGAFYEETMKALWGYVADKLSIPVSMLNRDNVRESLNQRGADAQLIDRFIHTLDDCEFARFAPGDAKDTMDKVYASAEEVINQMESELKKK